MFFYLWNNTVRRSEHCDSVTGQPGDGLTKCMGPGSFTPPAAVPGNSANGPQSTIRQKHKPNGSFESRIKPFSWAVPEMIYPCILPPPLGLLSLLHASSLWQEKPQRTRSCSQCDSFSFWKSLSQAWPLDLLLWVLPRISAPLYLLLSSLTLLRWALPVGGTDQWLTRPLKSRKTSLSTVHLEPFLHAPRRPRLQSGEKPRPGAVPRNHH